MNQIQPTSMLQNLFRKFSILCMLLFMSSLCFAQSATKSIDIIAKETKILITDIAKKDFYYDNRADFLNKAGTVAEELVINNNGYYKGRIDCENGKSYNFTNVKVERIVESETDKEEKDSKDFYQSLFDQKKDNETAKKDDDGDGVLNADDACPQDKGTKNNNGCPEKNTEIVVQNKQIEKESAPQEQETFTDEKQIIMAIINDAHNDFSKYKGTEIERNGGATYFKYNLAIGGYEDFTEYTMFATSYSYHTEFTKPDVVAQGEKIKNILTILDKEMVEKYKYTITKDDGITSLSNAKSKLVYYYKVTNNKLEFLEIGSCGDAQIKRSKEFSDFTNNHKASGIGMMLSTKKLKYKQTFAKSATAFNFEITIDYSKSNADQIAYDIAFLEITKNIMVSSTVLKSATTYLPFTDLMKSVKLKDECTIVLSDDNYLELKNKGETKMDFGKGIETFTIIKKGRIEYPAQYEKAGFLKKCDEIIIANADKTIIIGYFDYKSVTLITKIKTPETFISLESIGYSTK